MADDCCKASMKLEVPNQETCFVWKLSGNTYIYIYTFIYICIIYIYILYIHIYIIQYIYDVYKYI